MRVLVAMDKFKGSMSALEACESVSRAFPECECDSFPIADGGEGTVEALVNCLGGRIQSAEVSDALGQPIEAIWGLAERKGAQVGIIEMCAASGLAILGSDPKDPQAASTFGTGQLMQEALSQGCRKIVVGIGGSATNDGGTGMARALGYRFLDAAGLEIIDLPAGLDRLHAIAPPANFPEVEVIAACDVENPLLGSAGATRVYGPQKGVEDFDWFESRLERLANVVSQWKGEDLREVPGAGAAGGLGFGLLVFCGARLTPGFEMLANLGNLERRVQEADVVLTGEGSIDAQTLFGKGPAGVARMARGSGVRVIGFGGRVVSAPGLHELFDHLVTVAPPELSLAECILRGPELLEKSARAHKHLLEPGTPV